MPARSAAWHMTFVIEILTISCHCYLATTGVPPLAEEPANLVLEHLRAIRGSVERTEYDIKDLKFRIGQMEQTLVHHTLRFDRIETRLGLIEKRLGLVDA
jgi:hypothetical protein